MHSSVHPRRLAIAARCAGAVASVAMLMAPARADAASPLTPLLDAAAQRLHVADPVAAYKWNTHEAVAENIDRDYVTRVFGDQISATEAIEYSRFADWKLDAASAPADAPELSSSRSAIDALNQTMLTEISANWGLLRSPQCATQLDAARSGVIQAHQFDNLYRQALSSATQSYCQQ